MMMTLLLLKSRIKTFYEKHYRIVRSVLKVLLVFISLLLVTGNMDYSNILKQYWMMVLLALICGFMPDIVSAAVMFLVVGWEIYSAVPVMGIFVLLIILMYFLLLGRMERGQPYVMLAIPLLSMTGLEYVVPVVVALFVSPAMIPAMFMGIVLQFTMLGVKEYVTVSAEMANTANLDTVLVPFQYIVDYLGHNRVLAVALLAFGVTFASVYLIRRASYKHGSQIAILVGTLMLLAVELFGNIILDLDINPLRSTVQALAAMIIAYIVQFFRITLDYHGTRKLQFEDDEYYYYVTAIPKYKVAVVDKTVTRIVPDDTGEPLDLKEELEKTLEEETGDSDSEW